MDAGEGGGDLEIFFLCDRVKFVIVTACAIDGEPKKALRHRADEILHLVLAHDFALRVAVGLESVERSTDEEAGRGDRVRVVWLDSVASDL